ncbi:MAG TPA: hypothetical protein PKX15_00845 [Bacteroidales bacterium]|nr:hypothetical protein [Bacteroidales bacterium]
MNSLPTVVSTFASPDTRANAQTKGLQSNLFFYSPYPIKKGA